MKLYFLTPYYILRYEKLDTDEGFQKMLKEYEALHSALDKAHKDGILDSYEISNIQEFLRNIIEYVAEKNKYVKKEPEKIMGGIRRLAFKKRTIALWLFFFCAFTKQKEASH